MRFGSVCSGIEAASVAWNPLGWEAAWFSEIESFPSQVLAHHYPDVVNLGDMTKLPTMILNGEIEAPDILCGGTPCQAFSVAGNRQSLDDARGNLTLTFCEIADAIDRIRIMWNEQPSIIFWENVPGVLSTKDNAFGCFLAELAGEDMPLQPSGKRWTNAGVVLGSKRAIAWRVLDAQYFGLAQRRKRVFVVASAREGFDPAKILFESEGLRRDTAPSRKAGKEVTELVGTLAANGGGLNRPAGNCNELDFCVVSTGSDPELMATLCAKDNEKWGCNQWVSEGKAVLQTYGIPGNWIGRKPENGGNAVEPMHDVAPCLTKADQHGVASNMAVRRLTPTECERLQGFPDGYTDIKPKGKDTPDGPRYKALGNSWAVPVVRWIGERICSATTNN